MSLLDWKRNYLLCRGFRWDHGYLLHFVHACIKVNDQWVVLDRDSTGH